MNTVIHKAETRGHANHGWQTLTILSVLPIITILKK